MTVQDAAQLLGISTRRVRQYIEEGRIQATKINNRLYWIDDSEKKLLKLKKNVAFRHRKD